MPKRFVVENNFRYERKFTSDLVLTSQMVLMIKRHSGFFKEIFYKRRVNNIYFDTPSLDFYRQNIDGNMIRKKVRVRWYGDTFTEVNKPVLEIKFRNGTVGNKWSFPLRGFSTQRSLTSRDLKGILSDSSLPQEIQELCKTLKPSLLNSYQRRYFQSADKDFRVTIDEDLSFKYLKYMFAQLGGQVRRIDLKRIMELKYSIESDQRVQKVASEFPFRLSKSSKYCDGIDLFIK